jgi:hypothetical protein
MLNEQDITYKITRSASAVADKTLVEAVHRPTGVTVHCGLYNTISKNKNRARAMLEGAVAAQKELEELYAEVSVETVFGFDPEAVDEHSAIVVYRVVCDGYEDYITEDLEDARGMAAALYEGSDDDVLIYTEFMSLKNYRELPEWHA